jgi:hypothetical protein
VYLLFPRKSSYSGFAIILLSPIGLVKLIPGQEKALFHNNAWSILYLM